MNKTINLRITDASGHTDLVQDLAEGIQTVIDQHFKQGKWAYVGARVFQFTATSTADPALLNDAAALRELLLESPEGVTVTLAGDLAGGATFGTCLDSVRDGDTKVERTVTVRVTDASGHTETTEGLGLAIAKTIEAHLKNRQWAYVNSNVFQFDEDALHNPVSLVAETARLREFVESVEGPVTITLTGDLAGGVR